MAAEIEKPGETEIHVRMDCNGCVQKIKKALYGINGIYDLYIDLPQQKLKIIGWADPEKIVKAIRKTRKIATICSHTEPTETSAQPTEQTQQAAEGGEPPAAASETPNPSPAEVPPPAEPPKDPPPPETPQPEEKPSPSSVAAETNTIGPGNSHGPKDVGKVHVMYHNPPNYGYGNHWNRYANGPGLPPELPQPVYVSHYYNTYKPSRYEYQYAQSPPRHTLYSRTDHYNEDYHDHNHNGNIMSVFSEENPNACRIV